MRFVLPMIERPGRRQARTGTEARAAYARMLRSVEALRAEALARNAPERAHMEGRIRALG